MIPETSFKTGMFCMFSGSNMFIGSINLPQHNSNLLQGHYLLFLMEQPWITNYIAILLSAEYWLIAFKSGAFI